MTVLLTYYKNSKIFIVNKRKCFNDTNFCLFNEVFIIRLAGARYLIELSPSVSNPRYNISLSSKNLSFSHVHRMVIYKDV